jgi:uncharacterized protein GlcG (DUF336 family)
MLQLVAKKSIHTIESLMRGFLQTQTPRHKNKEVAEDFIKACNQVQIFEYKFFAVLKDCDANSISFFNGNGSGVIDMLAAEAKAHAALRYRKSTSQLTETDIDNYGNHPILEELTPGGMLLRNKKGGVLGAVAVSSQTHNVEEIGQKILDLMSSSTDQ